MNNTSSVFYTPRSSSRKQNFMIKNQINSNIHSQRKLGNLKIGLSQKNKCYIDMAIKKKSQIPSNFSKDLRIKTEETPRYHITHKLKKINPQSCRKLSIRGPRSNSETSKIEKQPSESQFFSKRDSMYRRGSKSISNSCSKSGTQKSEITISSKGNLRGSQILKSIKFETDRIKNSLDQKIEILTDQDRILLKKIAKNSKIFSMELFIEFKLLSTKTINKKNVHQNVNKFCNILVQKLEDKHALLISQKPYKPTPKEILRKQNLPVPSEFEFSKFLMALKTKEWETVLKFVIKFEDNIVNKRDHAGMQPIHWACFKANFFVVKFLIQYGAKINSYDLVSLYMILFLY